MFGIEHEFFVINSETKRPVGFPSDPTEMPLHKALTTVRLDIQIQDLEILWKVH